MTNIEFPKLTSQNLRKTLDQWCKDQPEVARLVQGPSAVEYQARLETPDYSSFEPRASWYSVAEGLSDGSRCRFMLGADFLLLTALAIEHRYLPWLRLAAAMPYTGAKAARLALGAMNESTEEPEEKTLKEVLEINDGLTTEDSQARVGAVKPLSQVIAQVQQDLGDRVSVEGGECNE